MMYVKHRTSECVLDAINAIISVLASRNFDAVSLRCDGEKAITPFIRELLQTKKLVCDICGPGQHCPNIVKAAKNKVRGQEGRCSSLEAFTGRMNDAKLHFRGNFGDLTYATRRESTNSVRKWASISARLQILLEVCRCFDFPPTL